MKGVLLIALMLAPLHAQISEPTAPAAANVTTSAPRTAADLDTLLGPIALYPDALIGLILPASTTPADIVLAARALGTGNAPVSVEAQPWDDSIKGLVHYPDLLRWLDQNLTWTQALGEAFASQPADVMNAVQRLRQQARAAGTLVDTPQQRIVSQENTLVIVPAQQDVIYVPVYDPTVVYISSPAFIHHRRVHFYSSYRTGPWLCYTPNWRHGYLHVGGHHWNDRPSHHVYHHYGPPHAGHVWSPRPARPHHHSDRYRDHRYSAHSTKRPSSFLQKPAESRPTDRPSRPTYRASSKPAFFNEAPQRTPRHERREHLLPSRSEPAAPSGFLQPDSPKRKRK